MAKNKNYEYRFFNGLNFPKYDPKNKFGNQSYHFRYMLNRLSRAFEYEGLPENVTRRYIEFLTLCNGYGGWAEYNGELWYFMGSMGGEPDPEYFPTRFIVANPALKMSKEYEINKDCIIMGNDSSYLGIANMFSKYSALLSENEISMMNCDIWYRIRGLLTAGDSKTKAGADEFFKRVIDGDFGITIPDNDFLESLKTYSFGNGTFGSITDLIEFNQYIKASWFNEIGLNSNYNMKREAINSGEAELNKDALLPLILDMLYCREEAVDKVNKMFGTNIKVKLSNMWNSEEKIAEDPAEAPESPQNDAEEVEAEDLPQEDEEEQEKPVEDAEEEEKENVE